MESSSKPGGNFCTRTRLGLSVAMLTLLAALGSSGCNSAPGTAGNSNGPNATMTVNGAPANATKGGPPAPPVTTPLPEMALNAELKDTEGKAFKLSDYKGKVVLIDLWATWCGPCRYEVPELVKLQTELRDKGFEIVGLDIDPGSDSLEDVQAFMDEYKINYKVAFAEKELAQSLMKGGNIPQSLVVSRDGRITKHFIGYNPQRTPPLMRQAIEEALK